MARATVAGWMETNPHAAEVVELWLDERKAGKTLWSIDRLVRELQEEHKFPFHDHAAFSRYLSRTYGKRYHQAVSG